MRSVASVGTVLLMSVALAPVGASAAISRADYGKRATAVCKRNEARFDAASAKYLRGSSITDPDIFEKNRKWAKRMKIILADYNKGLRAIPRRSDAKTFITRWFTLNKRFRAFLDRVEKDGPVALRSESNYRQQRAGKAWARAATKYGIPACGRGWTRKPRSSAG